MAGLLLKQQGVNLGLDERSDGAGDRASLSQAGEVVTAIAPQAFIQLRLLPLGEGAL